MIVSNNEVGDGDHGVGQGYGCFSTPSQGKEKFDYVLYSPFAAQNPNFGF